MNIKYKETKDFVAKDVERLFLSVNWESGKYLDLKHMIIIQQWF